MQTLLLSPLMTILLSVALWFFFQFCIPMICLRIPEKFLDHKSFLFKSHAFEKSGNIYKHLGVHRWKKFLPDGAVLFKNGFRKKTLEDISIHHLQKFVMESCRAELTHYLAILPFWVFGFIGPPAIIIYMLVYALAANLPCIIAQRYNRPRMIILIEQLQKNQTASGGALL